MNLRALAERDLAKTLEDSENGGACEMLFVDPAEENEYTVRGRVGDIGFMFDTDGNPIAGRCVCATWRLKSMMTAEKYVEPGRGWALQYTDLSARVWRLYVTRFEPDRTLGIGRVFLSLDLR